jgi:Ca2+-binding EF-hand superfamily protein
MKSLAPKIIPVAIASILCGIAMAGGDKDDHMKMMDTDGDGKVTSMEHSAAAKTMFTKMDSNSDGRVTAAEMDAAHRMKGDMKDDKMARHEDGHDKENAADKSYGKADKMASADKIAALDTNNDGALTAEEHAAGSKKMFGKMDANRDGMLTAQEMRDGHRKEMSASDQ